MTYDQAKSIILRFFDGNQDQYRVSQFPNSLTEHVDVWYGRSEKFEIDLFVDRYVIEYHLSSDPPGKEKRIELSRVAPYMLEQLLKRHVILR